jgi:hypothetical protein
MYIGRPLYEVAQSLSRDIRDALIVHEPPWQIRRVVFRSVKAGQRIIDLWITIQYDRQLCHVGQPVPYERLQQAIVTDIQEDEVSGSNSS